MSFFETINFECVKIHINKWITCKEAHQGVPWNSYKIAWRGQKLPRASLLLLKRPGVHDLPQFFSQFHCNFIVYCIVEAGYK